MSKVVEIVESILLDLKDRKGLRQEWDQIDHNIQQEIKEGWIRIVEEILN